MNKKLQHIMERAQQDDAFRRRVLDAPLSLLAEYDVTKDELIAFLAPNFRWQIEGKLAGVARPRDEVTFALLRALGITSLLSLSEHALSQEDLQKYGFQVEHIPIVDFTAPTIEQIEHATSIINGFLEKGRAVAVHCGAGLGRTGTILASYLIWQGQSTQDAIMAIRARLPGSIETPAQEAVLELYEKHLLANRSK